MKERKASLRSPTIPGARPLVASPQVATSRLGFGEKVGYALGDTACNLYWKTLEFFLLLFYTEVFGISAAQAGTMFLVTRVWDAINDPLMGILADRTQSRWGKFRPYLLWFALPLAAAGVLTFTTPDLEGNGKLAYAYATYVVMMMVYTAVNIPYSALLGVMSPASSERTSLSSFRFIGAFTGAVVVQWSTLRLVAHFGAEDPARGWQLTMAIYGAVAAVLMAICFLWTRERVQPLPSQRVDLFADLRALVRHGPWRVMLFLGVLVILNFSLRGSAAAFYFKYWVGERSAWGVDGSLELFSVFLTSGGIANILGVASTKALVAVTSKRVLYAILMASGGLVALPFAFLPPESVETLLWLNVVGNFILGPTAPLLFAMYADTADHVEWSTGRRATGLVFSGAMFSMKLGGALGGFLAGMGLSWVGYVPNQAQRPEALQGLLALMGIVPCVLGLGAAGLAALYRLDDRTMLAVCAGLRARKEAEESGSGDRSRIAEVGEIEWAR